MDFISKKSAWVLVFLLIISPTTVFAGSSNNEAKKEIQGIEKSENVDEKLGVTEGERPKPPKKGKGFQTTQQDFQARQGFQQDSLISTADQRQQ